MDMILKRTSKRQDGILGELQSDDIVSFKCATLEHAYTDEQGGWEPKIPEGFYKCVRGMHQLVKSAHPFETFEITDVPEHTKILFHVGNFNNDSEGCVLLGEKMIIEGKTPLMIANSKVTFEKFMNMQHGVEEFNLTVIDYQMEIGRS